MKKLTWKKALWFVLAFSFLSAMYKAIEPLLPLDISDESKKSFQTMINLTEKEQIKREALVKKDIDRLSIDIEKSNPTTEHDELFLLFAKLYKDFKDVDVEHSSKLNNVISKNNIDDALTIETYKSLALIEKYINSYEKTINASIEYNQSYRQNVDRMQKKAKTTLLKDYFESFNRGFIRTQTKALKMLNSAVDNQRASLDLLKVVKHININNFFIFENGNFYIQDDDYLDKFNRLVEKQNLMAVIHNKNFEEYNSYMKQTVKEGKDLIK